MNPLTLLAVIAGAGLFVVLIENVIRRSTFAAGLIMAYFVVATAGIDLPFIALGGITVYIPDLLSTVLITGATARLLRVRKFTASQHVFLAVAALIALSMLRGIAAYGIPSSVNEARFWIAFAASAAYFSTVGPSPSVHRRIGEFWLWSGVALACLAVARWVVLATGLPLGGIFIQADGQNLRVLGSDPTTFIALAFFIAAPALQSGGRVSHRRIAVGLLAVAVLLQHRSVWVAIIIGLLVLMRRNPQLSRRLAVLLVIAVTAGGALILTVFENEPEELSSRATNSQTFGWRVEGWRQLAFEDGPTGPVEVVSGKPFGSGWQRRVGGNVVVEAGPHSFWIAALLRLGVVGVAALLYCYGRPVVAVLRRPTQRLQSDLLNDDTLVSLLVVQATFSLAYNPPAFPTGIIVGLALSLASRRTSVLDEQPVPATRHTDARDAY
jgi:hypothetical protein